MSRATAVALALSLTLLACRRAPERPPVILISIDTLRADHLRLWGYGGTRTPNIDALARDGIVFENAYSHVPLTLPSHASILTGLLPPDHGVRDNLGYQLDTKMHPTIVMRLKDAGYRTGGAVSAYILRAATGIAAGFDEYDDGIPVVDGAPAGAMRRAGTESEAIAERFVDTHENEPFFYFLHLFEPHAPYRPSYDGAIESADAIVGRFLDRLRRDGVYERALIIVLSDHGEGLLQHGEQEHGVLLYREDIHVPLIVKLPGSTKGRRVATPVALVDVAPTIAEAAGVTLPPGAGGVSLLRAAGAARAIYSETAYPRIHLGWSELRSAIDARNHLIDGPSPELFAFPLDPGERRNLAGTQRRVVNAMRAEISKAWHPLEAPQVNREEQAKLESLGYVSAAAPAAGELPDPRARIHDLESLKQLAGLRVTNRDAAVALARTLLGRNPRWSDVWEDLGSMYEQQRQYDAAIDAYRQAIHVAPSLAPELATSIANCYLESGRYEEAEKNAGAVVGSNPGPAHQLLGEIALARHDFARAGREASAAMLDATQRRQAQLLLAETKSAAGDLRAALLLLDELNRETETRRLPPLRNLEFLRADALAQMNRLPAAARAFDAEVAAFPDNLDAWAQLAMVNMIQGRRDEMRRTFERMAAANPNREAYLFAAKRLEELHDPEAAKGWRSKAGR